MNLPARLVAAGIRAILARALPDSVRPQERALVDAANKAWGAPDKWPKAEAEILSIAAAKDPLSEKVFNAAFLRAGRIMQGLDYGIEDEITDAVAESWAKGYDSGVKTASQARWAPPCCEHVERAAEAEPIPLPPALPALKIEPVPLLKYVDPVEPFTVLDNKAINWLRDDTRFWVRDAWNHELGGRIANAARGALIEGVGRRELAKRLKKSLHMFNEPDSYWNVVASSGMVRARSFGTVSGMDGSGVSTFRFRATIDQRTCFAAGTPVTMSDGSQRAIETIRPGELVMSCRGRPRVVTSKHMRIMRQWVTLDTEDGRRLRVTPEHPILTPDGWLEAGRLRVKDGLALAEGTELAGLWDDEGQGLRPCPVKDSQAAWAVVVAVAGDAETEPAYDLSVRDDHGYLAAGLVVHNSDQCHALNGTVWEVQQGLDHIAKVADTEGDELKEVAPWLPAKDYSDKDADGKVTLNKSPDELAALGIMLPPVHGNCRSRIVAEGFRKIGG